MTKLTPKRKPILRIILLSIAAVPVLFTLYIIGALLLSPVFDGIDKNRFVKLDNDSRTLYGQLQAASGGEEDWQYETECEDIRSGPWPTGEYNCSITMSTKISTASSTELRVLHDKYFPFIDTSTMLKQKTELDKQPPGQFGVAFVVSGAEKRYMHVDDGNIDCTYLAKLDQTEGDASFLYGSTIVNSLGLITISLDCSAKATGNWFAN